MEELLTQVVQDVRRKYYGKYRGFVVDVDDPEKRARVRLRVPSVLGTAETSWALPCLPFGGSADVGFFAVPEVNAQVWVEFEEGDLSHPIWTGTFWQRAEDVPTEAAISPPTTRVWKTPSGHRLQFADEANDQKVVITDSHGNTITLDRAGTRVEDSNGNVIEMAAAGITVKGQQVIVKGTQVVLGGDSGEPLIKGTSFLTLFATHTHPINGPFTSPPVPQGEMSTLSSKVMTS